MKINYSNHAIFVKAASSSDSQLVLDMGALTEKTL